VFNDLDLMAILYLADLEVASRPSNYLTISATLTKWKQRLMTYGPGTIDLNLNELSSSNNAIPELIEILDTVNANLEKFGHAVPASILNQQCNAPGVRFFEYPTSLLRPAITRLRQLLTE